MKQAAAVLVSGRQRVGGIRRYGVMGGGALSAHGGQTASHRARTLHLHPFRKRNVVFNTFLLVHSRRGGPRIRRDVLRRRRGESVQVRAGVGRRRERARGGRGRRAAARVDRRQASGGRRARVVQARLAEGAHGPRVVVVGRQSRFAPVQP